MKHTPTPWEARDGDPTKENRVADVRGLPIFGPYAAVACGDDRAFIVHACNSHDDLLAALKATVAKRADKPSPWQTDSHQCDWCGNCVDRLYTMQSEAIDKAEPQGRAASPQGESK